LGEPTPACYGMSEWFDSTDPTVHLDCKALCEGCLVIDRCRRTRDELLERGLLIEGTWAGELYGNQTTTCSQPFGWFHHKKYGEQVCDDCVEARREYRREYDRAHRAKQQASA
jgi:hypothetical protein